MTIKEAIEQRHTVRKYTDKELSADIVEKLNQRIEKRNKEYRIQMQLVTGKTDGFNAIVKLILAKGVKNYLILAGPDKSETDENLGYCGIDIALFAQTLGLNSWWVGGTFNRGKMTEKVNQLGKEKVIGIITLGYGKENGKPHKSKNTSEVSHYDGGEEPVWFKDGVKTALLAPTALNKQKFWIESNGDTVSITCDNGIFTGADLGIVKYHFEVGAGTDNFKWK